MGMPRRWRFRWHHFGQHTCQQLTGAVGRRQVRVAYGRIAVRPDGMCEIDVFVQEVDGMRIHDECAPIIHMQG